MIKNQTFMGSKPFHIRFDEIDGFIKLYDGIRSVWYNDICNRITYLIIEKGINYNVSRIRIDSYSFLPIERTLTFHTVIILIKSVANKNESNYNYNIVFRKRFVWR